VFQKPDSDINTLSNIGLTTVSVIRSDPSPRSVSIFPSERSPYSCNSPVCSTSSTPSTFKAAATSSLRFCSTVEMSPVTSRVCVISKVMTVVVVTGTCNLRLRKSLRPTELPSMRVTFAVVVPSTLSGARAIVVSKAEIKSVVLSGTTRLLNVTSLVTATTAIAVGDLVGG